MRRPRALVHRGSVEAAGFYFDLGLLGVDEARRRVLALWDAGASLYRVSGGLLLRLPRPLRVACARAPGLPLIALGSGAEAPLAAAPVTPQEREELRLSPGMALFVREGAWSVELLREREEPATWLDLGRFETVPVGSLGRPPERPKVVEAGGFDTRQRLTGAPPAASLQQAMEALRSQKQAPPGGGSGAGSGAVGSLFDDIAGFARQLGRVFEPPRGAGESWLNRAGEALNRGMAHMMVYSQLSGQVGHRQAEYLSRMVEMFEQNRLMDALRHAIPLSRDGGDEDLPPAFGVPSPRDDLSITLSRTSGGSGIGVGDDVMDLLRKLYRRAFEQLDADGRVDEAAFVLAELLQESEEAVAYLERRGKLRLAAELAEGRKVAPGLIVRQWFLAGDTERAVQVARRTGAFADAVARLERSDRKQAEALRMLWAASLAGTGDYAGAVEAAWPVPEARGLVLDWIERARALGGVAGARMLARKLEAAPDAAPEIRKAAFALLDDDWSERAPERLAFAKALWAGPNTPPARALARAAVRAVARDVQQGHIHLQSREFTSLAEFSGDAALRADSVVPHSRPGARLAEMTSPLDIDFSPADVGALPLYEAALLPDGRCLVALGEAGARLVTWDGRTAADFNEPAHRLVVSDHGTRAVALAARGPVARLSRLNLDAQRATSWCEAQIDTFATSYDGSLWFVAAGSDLLAIDVTMPGLIALWRMQNLGDHITAIGRGEFWCSVLARHRGMSEGWGRLPQAWERWERCQFSLPQIEVRHRAEVLPAGSSGGEPLLHRAISPGGTVADLHRAPERNWDVNTREQSLWLVIGTAGQGLNTPDREPQEPLGLIMDDTWVVALGRMPGGVCCYVVDVAGKRVRARISLHGATWATPRLTGDRLALADDRGRLIVLDFETGRLLRNLRLS